MVFHDINRLSDVLSGQRIIIYYIREDETSCNLYKSVECIMDMLVKKNDDLLIFKLARNTQQFSQFKELYKPEISAKIALFAINAEGLPIICKQIFNEDSIHEELNAICQNCQLNSVSKAELVNVKCLKDDAETLDDINRLDTSTNGYTNGPAYETSQIPSCENNFIITNLTSKVNSERQEDVQFMTKLTELQIRLPDGSREKQKFNKYDLLQEVYDFISSKFNLNDFDLKTYNHNVFSAAEYEKTLEDLDLTPNGVIIVVYKSVVPFNSTNGIYKTVQYSFWFWFGKLTPFIQYVQGLFSAFWNSFFASGNRRSNQISNQGEGSQSSSNRNTSNRGNKSSSRFGNIHTIRRNEDSDDENNRYNGNSTQQK